MSEQSEGHLAVAERHVRDGEVRIARHLVLIEELDRYGHPEAAAEGRELVATLQRILDLTRTHLRFEKDLERTGLTLQLRFWR